MENTANETRLNIRLPERASLIPVMPKTKQDITLPLILTVGLREESEMAQVPRLMRGTALNLIIAGILSMAFMGFAGLFSAA
jgi:Na+-translocating ferredoxin:NAD+ oxidoreductase RnfA subunit